MHALLLAFLVYLKPPAAIQEVLNAPAAPTAILSPARDYLLLGQPRRYPPIAELAEPMLALAGQRINPYTNGPHRANYLTALLLLKIADGSEARLSLPPNARITTPEWSPDGKRFAFTHTTSSGIELWLGDTAGRTRKLRGGLNNAYGDAVQWMPDSRTLLVQLIPETRGRPPEEPRVPPGPHIQEGSGKAAPVRTYQDLLKNPHDENLFDYYATSQLALIDAASAQTTPVGKPGIFATAAPSPDGRHFLVARLRRPYSFLHIAAAFPKEVEVWDSAGHTVHKLASLPLAEVPIDGVRTGPREYGWRATAPATLAWVEALDGGDPKKRVPHRDRLLLDRAPFTASPVEVLRTEHRITGFQWGERDGLLVREYDRNRVWRRVFLADPDQPGAEPRLLWSLSARDRYKSPGEPLARTVAGAQKVLLQSGNWIFLVDPGATPEGERPFLNRYNWKTGESEPLFRSAPDCYESVEGLLASDTWLTRRETPVDPPNYYVRQAGLSQPRPLTHFADPTPQLRRIQKRLVKYQRPDGVPLSFTLYLPPEYKAGTPLPTVVWAYPREYTDAETAGQVAGSPQRFTTLTGISHLFLLLAGYAVLDNASMPVVGDPETVNNTYIEQIVASARAAVDKAVEMGWTDRNRVAVGGHSYGAFMTANLLAHSDLFRAGIARSGAYNRTLTPFGFQTERRTFWEAPDLYLKMSPFVYANKIHEPLLLIHGEADNNPGTFPVQSERLYQAVRGHGGTVRLVMLPHESHGYAARESIEHVHAEMVAWLDRYLK